MERNYVEKLHRNDSTLAKKLSFLEYWKLINTGQSDHDFFLLKTLQKKHLESNMCIKMTSTIRPSKFEQNIRTKMFLWSTKNQCCFNFKLRRWFNIENWSCFDVEIRLSFRRYIKILIFQASWHKNKIVS